MTTFKRMWWEDGVLHERDIDPADIYLDAEAQIARNMEAMMERLKALKSAARNKTGFQNDPQNGLEG